MKVVVTIGIDINTRDVTIDRVRHAISTEVESGEYDIIEVVTEDGEDLTDDGL